MQRKKRILFFGESLSLCHITRPLVLARSLDPCAHDVHFACHSDFHHLLSGLTFNVHGLNSLPSQVSQTRLANGRPMFSSETLKCYVEDDLRLIAAVSPDLIVGDMRQSLAVSARLAGVPYASISNAYWSPFARQTFDVPELPITRVLGPGLVRPFFRTVLPLSFRSHAAPLNHVRKAYGLPGLGTHLGDIYSHADYRLYADVPELVPTSDLPANHHYIGPILWSAPAPLPEWWDQLPDNRPIVYVSPGSSGKPNLLVRVLKALADLDVTIVAGTSERFTIDNLPSNAFVAPFLPAEHVLRRASLFISHGGSASAYVALAQGTPVLGIPSNMDQHLSSQYIQQAMAGRRLRSEQASPARIRQYVTKILEDEALSREAQRMSSTFANFVAEEVFRAFVDDECKQR